jgi:GNAT superfamily N-acetyltransferase
MVTIRPPTAGDERAIAELLSQLGYPVAVEALPARLARLSADPGQWVLVAEVESAVVGLAAVRVRHLITDDAPFGRLSALVVRDDRRGQGIGRALVAEAEHIVRQAGCDRMEVTSGDHRPSAHAFYRALGFQERPRRFLKCL